MKYQLATVPSPSDVLNYPLSLFVTSVVECDDVLQHITQKNYKSYVAAISVATYKKLSSPKKYTADILSIAATYLSDFMKEKNIQLDEPSTEILDICSAITSQEAKQKFDIAYNDFCKSIQKS